MKELEVYVHIPFCVKKCMYCDFLSFVAGELVKQSYVDQLLREIKVTSACYKEYLVTTVFIGGGTPSCLKAEQIEKILLQLKRCFHIEEQAEITIECNPGTVGREKLQSYLESGINRLSFGLQSVHDQELKMLGRIHTFRQFLDNYELARKIGFRNINVDLMMALPGQKLPYYEQSLWQAVKLGPEHISSYSLIIEQGTLFYDLYKEADDKRMQDMEQELLPTEDEERDMYERTKEVLHAFGYCRYEISNYAKEGYECRHNNGYWQRKNYLGLGLGAASLVENTRFQNISDFNGYLSLEFRTGRPDYVNKIRLEIQEQMEEFMYLGLRRMKGVSSRDFFCQFGTSIEQIYGEVLRKQERVGLIRPTVEGYCLTDYGIDVSNRAFADYLL